MGLDPQVQALLEQMQAQGMKSFEQMSVPEAREVIGMFPQMQGPAEDVAEVSDRTVPGPEGDIPVRIYRPEAEGELPVLLYFHGGGFVLGDLEVSDIPCRALANGAGSVVVSVDYRLAPEHKYPAGAEDCYAATVWAAEHASEFGGRGDRLAVSGDSAGGNMAAVVCLMARDRGGPPIALQVLIYPVTELECSRPSRTENAEGYLLTSAAMEWFGEHYLSDPAQAQEPYASPLLADDLSGLPPALVITAGYDPLRDEGDAYAEKLRDAGVEVRHETNPTMIHGFMWLGGVLDHTAGVYRMLGEHARQALGAAV